MGCLKIYLLGIPRIEWNNVPLNIRTRKTIALIAYLAMQPPETTVQRGFLAEFLWPDNDNNLTRLRRILHDLKEYEVESWLTIHRSALMLNAKVEIVVDAVQYDLLVSEVANEGSRGSLERAYQLYHGEFLHGLSLPEAPAFETWALSKRQSLKQAHIRLLEALSEQSQQDGEIKDAIQFTQELLRENPLKEASHRMLMRLYVQDKQRARAMQQYHDLVKLLLDELNEMPQPATQQLYDELLHLETMPEDTDPLVYKTRSGNSLIPPPPERLLGREADLEWLYINLLTDPSLLAISGLPCVGKSALLAEIVNRIDVHSIFPDGILWVTLGRAPDLDEKLSKWCRTLRLSPGKRAEETHAAIERALKQKRILIVIDDVWQESDTVYFKFNQANVKTIVTSRFQKVAKQLAGRDGSVHQLQPLSSEDSLEQIRHFAGDALDSLPDKFDAVLKQVDGLPPLLSQLGMLIHREWEFGLLDDFFLEDDVVEQLLDTIFGETLAQNNDNSAWTFREYFLANLYNIELAHAQALLKAFHRDNIQEATITTKELKKWLAAYDVRDAIHQLTGSGILSIVQPGEFSLHPIWFSVLGVN